MEDENYSENLRERSKKTAKKRVEHFSRSAEAITTHVQEHGMLRKEEFLASLKRAGKPSGHKIPDKLIPKVPT